MDGLEGLTDDIILSYEPIPAPIDKDYMMDLDHPVVGRVFEAFVTEAIHKGWVNEEGVATCTFNRNFNCIYYDKQWYYTITGTLSDRIVN